MSDRVPKVSAALFVFLSAAYAFTGSGHTHSPDEEDMFQTTRALVQARSTIEVSEDNDRVTSHTQGREGPVGRRPLGQSIVGIPMYLAGRVAALPASLEHRDTVVRLFTLLTNSVVTAAGAVLVLHLSMALGASLAGSALLGLGYGLGTFAWPLATTFFSDPLSATLLAALSLAAIRARRHPSTGNALVVGLLGGLAIGVRLTNVVFLPLVGIFLLTAWGKSLGLRAAAALAVRSLAGFALPLTFQLASSWWRYDSAFALAYSGPNAEFDTPLLVGLRGFLFSPGRSIFLFAPITLLASVGVIFTMPKLRWDAALLGSMAAVNLLLWSTFHSWEAGQVWGPRFMLITLPLWVALAASVIDSGWGRRSAILLVYIGIALNVPGIIVYQNAYYQVLAAEVGRDVVEGRVKYFHASVHDLGNSQIVGHTRLVAPAILETSKRISGDDPAIAPYPSTVNERYFWHDFPAQVDIWWATWLPKRAPAGYLWLAPAWAALMAIGAIGLRRHLRGNSMWTPELVR